MALAASPSLLSRQGQVDFCDRLVWQPPFWTSHAMGTRERREKQKIPSNGEELDKITNQ